MNAQDLKNSILQLAIQGKLVEQREEEGSAKELLEKIEEEKKQLIKEGKIKEQKSLPAIKEDEIPFDIPKSWEWVRLNQNFNFIDYRGKTPTKISDGVILITASNIRKGSLDFTKADFISESEYKDRQSRGITKKGDILFTTEAPLGNVAINTIEVASCGQRSITFQQYAGNVFSNELFSFFIQSPHFQLDLINNATGTTAKGIKAEKLKKLLLPFPPLEEQKRIVAKIEELMPYVDKYDKSYSELEELNKKFPEDMQKSILQYAIQGKLVEQRAEEGTAEELYKQIQEEKKKLVKEGKIKNTNELPEITDDEIPFDIPETWKWVRLGDIVYLTSGQDKTPNKYNDVSKGIPYLTGASNIKEGEIIINRWIQEPKSIAYKGDILITCKGTVGKTVILNEDKVHIARQLMSIRTIITDTKFIKYFVESYVNILKSKAKSMIPGIERKDVLEVLFALPPLAEQKRIVEKIEELLPLTKQLVK